MIENVKVSWLTDHEKTKVAPKTLSSQVYNEDGTLFKDQVSSSIDELSDRVDLINETLDSKANKTDIVQADWNQNDDTALDYVKNRTHWVEDDGETYHPLDEKFLPATVATKEYVEALYTKLNSNTVLGFYCVEDVTIVINGISKTYPANSNVEIAFIEGDVFEIIPTSDNSILTLTSFPSALGTYYSWLEGVKQFSNILFDMNAEDMYSKWSQGNQGSYQVQFAQYTNCIFWSDNPYISDVSRRTNYTLYYTTQLPLCYSTIPDNTFKSFYLAVGVVSDPNWGNPAYRDSFAKATWATQVFSYYGARTVGLPGLDSPEFNIVLPKDCRGLMFEARNIENAGIFDATNVTNFGAKSGSWRDAFGYCTSLRSLYIKNLKVNLDLSWSPINHDSIYYIISEAANTNAITISVSPYTYNLLDQSDFELAASKNITIALLTGHYVEDRRLSDIANKADKSYVDEQIANIPTPDVSGQISTHNTDAAAHADIREDVANAARAANAAQSTANSKADADHTHDDLYCTESEIDAKLSEVNTSISNITSGNTVVKEAEHAINADEAERLTGYNISTILNSIDIEIPTSKAVLDALNYAIANIPAQVQANWDQTDTSAVDYIKNKPDEADAMELICELSIIEPVVADDGSIYTDENNAIYTII